MKTGYADMACGLLGEHLGHSFSPIIHQKLADYSYELYELAPEAVGDFVRNGTLNAFNVTIPYKKAVMPFLDEISPEALAIGAVNTIVRQKDGRLFGYNTDYFGFSYMLDSAALDVRGKKAVVFGTGGASATVQCVLRDRGVRELVVIGRASNTPELVGLHTDAEIVVNTTPVGMYPQNGSSPTDLSLFPHCCGVLDVIYNPERTALILDAEERGIPAVSGLSMLVAQAVKAFRLFTGDPAEGNACETILQSIEAMTQNVVLVGMPGCGKSTVGRLLAERLGRPFYDADEVFTETYHTTPATVITAEGEERFREMEHEVLCELGKNSGVIIACGGGAVTREYNYRPLHQNGVIVFVDRPLALLPSDGRPLSQAKSPAVLYAERIDQYHRFADVEVANARDVASCVEDILSALDGYRNGKTCLHHKEELRS